MEKREKWLKRTWLSEGVRASSYATDSELKRAGIGNPLKSVQEGSNVINYASLKEHLSEHGCHAASTETKSLS